MSWYVIIAGLLRSPWMTTLTDPYTVSTSSSCIHITCSCAIFYLHTQHSAAKLLYMHVHTLPSEEATRPHQFSPCTQFIINVIFRFQIKNKCQFSNFIAHRGWLKRSLLSAPYVYYICSATANLTSTLSLSTRITVQCCSTRWHVKHITDIE